MTPILLMKRLQISGWRLIDEKYEVKITKMAYGHMQEIVRYISNELFAPDAAANLLDKFQKSINGLSDMPERYSLVDEEPWRSEGVRKIIVKNFLIYFWIDEPNSKVQVTGVIYGPRDQVVQLAKLDME